MFSPITLKAMHEELWPQAAVTHLVCVIVTDDTFVLGKSQLTALICCKGKRGQKARSQGMFWCVIVGNWNRTRRFLL